MLNNSNSNNNSNENNDRLEGKPKIVYPTCATCGKTNHSTEESYFRAIAAIRPRPQNRSSERQNQDQQLQNQRNSNEIAQTAAQVLN